MSRKRGNEATASEDEDEDEDERVESGSVSIPFATFWLYPLPSAADHPLLLSSLHSPNVVVRTSKLKIHC